MKNKKKFEIWIWRWVSNPRRKEIKISKILEREKKALKVSKLMNQWNVRKIKARPLESLKLRCWCFARPISAEGAVFFLSSNCFHYTISCARKLFTSSGVNDILEMRVLRGHLIVTHERPGTEHSILWWFFWRYVYDVIEDLFFVS